MVVEIRQLVNEISIFPDVLYKRGDLKSFAKFINKQKKQSFGGVLSRDVLKNLTKFTSLPESFLNKIPGWKPETVRNSHWR